MDLILMESIKLKDIIKSTRNNYVSIRWFIDFKTKIERKNKKVN